MKKHLIRIFQIFLSSEIMISILSFIFFRENGLLTFINMSFYVGGLFIFLGVLFYIVSGGFFDPITKSFRLFILGKKVSKKEIEEMVSPSQMITFSFLPILMSGLAIMVVMLIALYFYYVI